MRDNIRMDIKEMGWEDVGWTHLSQDSDQQRIKTVMKLRVL
jgi:hypothetical protein